MRIALALALALAACSPPPVEAPDAAEAGAGDARDAAPGADAAGDVLEAGGDVAGEASADVAPDALEGDSADDATADAGCMPPLNAVCDGRCVYTGTDLDHCGRCNNRCPSPPHAVAECAGECLFACSPGYHDCDRDAGNGCESAGPCP